MDHRLCGCDSAFEKKRSHCRSFFPRIPSYRNRVVYASSNSHYSAQWVVYAMLSDAFEDYRHIGDQYWSILATTMFSPGIYRMSAQSVSL